MTSVDYNKAVDLHADGVFRFALKHLRDDEQAKDVVQESFTRLWMKLDQVDAGKVKSYLFTTAHHLLVDQVRREKRSARMEPQHEALSGATMAQPDLKKILDEALATLPDIQRSVVLLRDLEGYAYEEIAELTGLSLAQVKVYIYRGRSALKTFIGELDLVI